MRPTIAILLLLICHTALSQQAPVDLNATVVKNDGPAQKLQLNFSIRDGWHVYADGDTALGLDPLIILVNENPVDVFLFDKAAPPVTIIDPVFNNTALAVYKNSFTREFRLPGNLAGSNIRVRVKGFASNDIEFLPFDLAVDLQSPNSKAGKENLRIPSIDINAPVSECGNATTASSKGLLAIFLLGFGGGLLALLTPCVFPMIPVTVSYFTRKAKSKRTAVNQALAYGASIMIIYLLASIPFHFIGNLSPQMLNALSTNAWVNIFFFAVFLLFALSLFGLFEITLPPSLANIAGSRSTLVSASGMFFMALTLVVVSFSCTGPILGSLLVGSISSTSGAWALTCGIAGFGFALALPFALFAMFPQLLQKLPKSGPWMSVVKKCLAFIELALALKFLSNADMVQHWGILKREVFVALWILIFLALALYLLGLFRRHEDFQPSPVLRVAYKATPKRLRGGRIFAGSLVLLFVFYLLPGLTQTSYARLKLLSGFPPPLSYSVYSEHKRNADALRPDVVNDYNLAIQLAKQQHKAVLIDFTGWACVNCRKMEDNVWSDPEIENLIKEKFVLVSLYVDDRERLPEQERLSYVNAPEHGSQQMVTLGDKNASFQAENFKQVTQPLYAILDPEERLMNHPVGYTPDVKAYKQWLECGYQAYERLKTK